MSSRRILIQYKLFVYPKCPVFVVVSVVLLHRRLGQGDGKQLGPVNNVDSMDKKYLTEYF